MEQKEFQSRIEKAGLNRKYTSQEFDCINVLYMAAGEMNKDVFCEDFAKHPEIMNSNIVATIMVKFHDMEELLHKVDHELAAAHKAISDLQAERDYNSKRVCDIVGENASLKGRIETLNTLMDATIENINLGCFDKLRKAFEAEYGKIETMRLRVKAGWNLTKEDIEYLLARD